MTVILSTILALVVAGAATATMENNSSAQALRRMLRGGPRTVGMRDFGSMENVGMLWRGLPRNDQPSVAQPGDIVLYQGNAIVVYYEPNSYRFTRLGRIDGVSSEELRSLLGRSTVEMTFELAD